MRYLPTLDDQEWLLRELGQLVEARGAEAFVAAPIVLPTPRFFPDPVDSPAAAADRITRRLLQYAGLHEFDVKISLFEDSEIESSGDATRCEGIAGCFLGLADGCCHLGLNADLLPDVEKLAAVMAHEVAHAFRAHHGLGRADRDEEELLTDVTMAYLGFGVLSVNGSYRFRKSGRLVGQTSHVEWSTSRVGYLPPQAHSFLLGCQIAVRALDDRARGEIYGQLETNQAAFVRAAVKAFESEEVRETVLGLPPRADWPSPREAQGALRPLGPCAPLGTLGETGADTKTAWNRGRPVFRIVESRAALYAVVDAAGLGALGLALSFWLLESWMGCVPFVVAGVFSGVRRGRPRGGGVCSDAGCRAALDPDAQRCPNCAGEVMGVLQYEDQRLEMEERFAEEARRRGRAVAPRQDRRHER
jgi:hypothetical protein